MEPEVLQAMTKPMITHRTKEYKELHGNIVEKMKKALDTDQDIMMVAGSASVFLEGAIRNGVSNKCLGMTGGSFGLRSIEIAELNGKSVEKVQVPWGHAPKPSDIRGRITKDIEMAFWVDNESSTGAHADSVALAKEVRSHNSDALVMVDAVTSAFAMDLKMKELRPDALIFGTQKALALPPGLAMIVVSEKMLEKSKKVANKGFYTDLIKLKKQNDENYALTTPPVSLMYALDFQLDRILKEGMAARYRRHHEMADLVRKWAAKHDGIFPEAGHQSDTIGVLNRGNLDFTKFHTALKAKGYEISAGYGDVKEETFRIGHMGDVTVAGVKELLSVMDTILEEMK